MFVNVPIGIVVAAAAPRVLAESPRRPGRIDAPGAVTSTGGIALLVYGLSKAATGSDGVSHWGDAQVLASLTASVALLVSFVWIERRSPHPLLPMRILADRNRAGTYLIMLCIATALFGLFFFLTLFMQSVLSYSAIQSGVAYLPFAIGVVAGSALASPLVARIGARPLILADAAAVAGGTFWFSRLTEHSGYTGQLLGPLLLTSVGLGLVFVPLSLVSLHNVAEQTPVSPPACSTPASRSAARSGSHCSAPSPGPPSRTASGLRPRTPPPRSRAPLRPRPSTTTPWRSASPVRSLSPQAQRCSACSSRSSPSGSTAGNWPVPRRSRRRQYPSPPPLRQQRRCR
ncbi:MFS transporter [Streptomyces sp. YIM S03343]